MSESENKNVLNELAETFKVITKGNVRAIKFLCIWFFYCHEIDDVLDTMEDGRPTLSKELILRSYARALELYNDPFYVEHQRLLYPVALLVTNAYANSVQWERSPKEHHRLIADVLRCSGNEMMSMVANICGGHGGYEWMRQCSTALWEKTWQMQHDPDGRPI